MARAKRGVPGFESAPKDVQRRQMQRMFRNVFSTPAGRYVFNVLLDDLCFFMPAETDADRARNEYAKYLIFERLGINDLMSITNSMLVSYDPDVDKSDMEGSDGGPDNN